MQNPSFQHQKKVFRHFHNNLYLKNFLFFHYELSEAGIKHRDFSYVGWISFDLFKKGQKYYSGKLQAAVSKMVTAASGQAPEFK